MNPLQPSLSCTLSRTSFQMRLTSKSDRDTTHSMSALDQALTTLHVLGSVVQVIPVVGESLKSATGIVTKICETVKKMKENRKAYEQLVNRATLILAAVTNGISEANTEKLKAMEEKLSCLLRTLQEISLITTARLQSPPAATGMLGFLKKFFRDKGKDALRVSADQEEIKKLEEKLDRAMKDFTINSLIRTEVAMENIRTHSARLLSQFEELRQQILLPIANNVTLATLLPVNSAGWENVDVASCMSNTRVKLLNDVITWAEDPTSSVVFWLNGIAGTGKSTVARTVCEYFAGHGLLGASFFISRQVLERRQAPDIIRTIAYQLATKRRMVADTLSTTLRDSPDLASLGSLQKLALELIFNSVGVLPADTRLLIVIDALDECACDKHGRPGGELLPILLSMMLKLSGRIKLLLTSRTDPVIARMLNGTLLDSQPKVVQLHDQDRAVVRSDIRTFLTQSFAGLVQMRPNISLLNWPALADLDTLVDLADPLFVYAATIVRFVSHPGYNPRARLDVMLSRREGTSASLYRCLDQLYMQVLRTSVYSDDQEDEDMLSDTLKAVVGSVVVAQEPLSIRVHSILIDKDLDEVQLMVDSLSALLLDPGSPDKPVGVFHSSFPDFIVNPQRCDELRFVVSLDEHHLRLACGCLALLNHHLRYNMANLQNPDIANIDVEHLDDRLLRGLFGADLDKASSLPQALYYAARHWSTHVAASSIRDSHLLDALSQFCRNHLFHWLELLSLIRHLTYWTQPNLLAVIRWCEHSPDDTRTSEIRDLLHDVVQTVKAYAEPIRSHALHAFHSVIPTMPHGPLLDTLTRTETPILRHSVCSPRSAGWGSPGDVLEAGSAVNKVVFSPDDLLVISCMDSGRIKVWNSGDLEEVAQFTGHKDEIWTLAISPDGLRIASGSCDGTLRVWDSQTFEELGICEHHTMVICVAFSPDNERIASGSEDGIARIWNASTLELVIRLTGHRKKVTVFSFFPDSTKIVSASLDGTLRLWDAQNYGLLAIIPCCGPVWMLVVSPDCTRLAWSEYTSGRPGVLHMLEISSRTEQAQMKLSQRLYPPLALAFSPNGALFATGTESGVVHVWNTDDLSEYSTVSGHQAGVASIEFSADGSKIVTGSHDGTVRISPITSCEGRRASIPGHDSSVSQVAFSPDGSRLVSSSGDHTVRIWDGITCRELAVLTGHEDYVWAVAFSLDGSRVISASSDRTIRVWDALNFQEVHVLHGHQDEVNCLVVSPDGAFIASGSDDRTVRLWSLTTLQEVTQLEGHKRRVWSVAFSPASNRLVSASQDKTIRIWETVRFAQLAEFEVHQQDLILVSAVFSLDGKAVLTRNGCGGGLAWVSDDEENSTWTEVPLSTAIHLHPGHAHPHLWSNGWLRCATKSGTSSVWLPVERRGGARAIASSESRIAIGGRSGAMNMLALVD